MPAAGEDQRTRGKEQVMITESADRTLTGMSLWEPVADAKAVELPARISPTWIGKEVVDNPRGPAIVRAHLVPLVTNDQRYKYQWRALWKTLSYGERNRLWTAGLLARWRQEAVAAEAEGLPDGEEKQRKQFLMNVEGAIDRLKRESEAPMAWADPEFSKYPEEIIQLVESLVIGIDEAAKNRITLEELHNNVLRALKVHPDTKKLAVPEVTREEVRLLAKPRQRRSPR